MTEPIIQPYMGKERKETLRRYIGVVIFAIAFAVVESAVVVYLRKIYFDGSFSFPLMVSWENGIHVTDTLIKVEFWREASTILMLAAVGYVSGRSAWQSFSFFMIAFGMWDIFYYIWLKVMIGWPESLMTWDLLFYIPLPWVAPVITPVLIAIFLITAGTWIIYYEGKEIKIRLFWYDWVIELGCAFLMITAFCWDWKNIMRFPDGINRSGVPETFAWWLYLPALITSVIYFIFRTRKIVSIKNS